MSATTPAADPAGAAPNCWKCRHLALTYEPRLPYLCRRLGIRTRSLPSAEVLRADGRPCAGFQPKASPGAVKAQAGPVPGHG